MVFHSDIDVITHVGLIISALSLRLVVSPLGRVAASVLISTVIVAVVSVIVTAIVGAASAVVTPLIVGPLRAAETWGLLI